MSGSSTQKAYSNVKAQINSISPSFCTAKWAQVTLHLHNGRTHSCHHPSTHKVPLEELENNPSALHNTSFKKEQRKKMLAGERPEECQYCWNVEDLPDYNKEEFFSDRVVKSAMGWSMDKMQEAIDKPPSHDINPSYVEISFSNICNFKCSYCSPVYSSRWTEELDTHGPYPTSTNFNNLDWYRQVGEMPIHHKEHNPYVEAFWDWWPNLVKDLKVFRMTGGEPLLANDTFKVLDFIYNNPQPQLELAVNTNGCVPDQKINSFIEKSKKLLNEQKISSIHIFTSVDGTGSAAEYGRYGLDYQKWYTNLDKFLTELPSIKVTIMSTVNIFSVTTYLDLLNDILTLKKKHGADRLSLDIAILRHPHHQCLSILTDEYRNYFDDCMKFMRLNSIRTEFGHFKPSELLRMDRLIAFTKAKPHQSENISIERSRKDFAIFVDEHDRRRKTNFLNAIPGLKNFYEECKELNKPARLFDKANPQW